ncbi:hypothetical protein TPHA_0J01180 [Tetrapisispora phaffii CBS 4417]|uniref:Catalase T n=1 Tax=Tetrapisispora phaffii (strain ATCC 24235 / CBS 4417 / NBRC 1672 / NRRL Y-8282 / UCD 70-5) TaxID=1071381 RepID=G8BYJ8_TETPH|nr:hypothetical protein TPHA_0J01180 [Tetrapisispora phaffii CBS 4417]CCE64940.1 hypothetical protein TPHA_0J01180 [Tetrapisispora phaffii CBS 4417]
MINENYLPKFYVMSLFINDYSKKNILLLTVEMSSETKKVYALSNGFPYSHNPSSSIVAKPDGPILLEDLHLVENIAHFVRERIPERVVHAKGGGCKFEFELTDSLSDITYAAPYQNVGYKCPGMIRVSEVTESIGGPDTVRDPRGFSFKLYTDWGNHDWVFNNSPTFFIRDGAKFPQFVHTQKKDPETHLDAAEDSTTFWDFYTQNLESIHQIVYVLGPRGIPKSWTEMNAYSGHTFRMVNDKGEITYVNYHIKSDDGFTNLTNEEAANLAATRPDFNIAQLRKDVKDGKNGKQPSYTCYLQTMTVKQAEEFRYSINDLTKIWPHKEFPLRKFGKITLTENVENFFQDIEQLAFSPANTCIPGIEPTNDNILQTRLFAYGDTQRYRLGVNYQQLPVNRPRNLNGATSNGCPYAPDLPKCPYVSSNFQRDGAGSYFNQGNLPTYVSGQSNAKLEYKALNAEDFAKNKYKGTVTEADLKKYIAEQEAARISHETIINSKLPGYNSVSGVSPLDLEQARDLYERIYTEEEKKDMIQNVIDGASNIANSQLKTTISQYFGLLNPKAGKSIADGLGVTWSPVDFETYVNDVVGRASPQ